MGKGYIVDDGSYCYSIIPIDGNAFWVDPHIGSGY